MVSLITGEVLHWYMVLIDTLLFVFPLVGLYSYIFRKNLFSKRFWHILLILSLVYSLLGLAYNLTHDTEVGKYLSYLSSVKQENYPLGLWIFSLSLVIPLYYAIYQLSRGKFLDKEKKKATRVKKATAEGRIVKWVMIGVMGLVIGGLSLLAITPKEEESVPTMSVGSFSNTELFSAINKEREGNKVNKLVNEESSCAIAKARVHEINEKGIGIFGQAASFQRTIDKVFKEDSSLIADSPNWYVELVTYQETVTDAIDTWSQGEAKALFTDSRYKVGCVAEENGFAIVILGSNEQTAPHHTQENSDESLPDLLKGTEFNSI